MSVMNRIVIRKEIEPNKRLSDLFWEENDDLIVHVRIPIPGRFEFLDRIGVITTNELSAFNYDNGIDQNGESSDDGLEKTMGLYLFPCGDLETGKFVPYSLCKDWLLADTLGYLEEPLIEITESDHDEGN